MNKQDCSNIKNWQDVEMRLARVIVQASTQKDQLIQINNSVNSFLNALVLNLKDLLESQSEISLWFYDDIPTISNKPYTDFTNKAEHYGDIYYSRKKGLIYQFQTNDNWTMLDDLTLLKAMSLTNSNLEANEHERLVFTTQPSPPYNSGDWWIKEDGSLFICQIGKGTSDRYSAKDWINSVEYAGNIAKESGDVLEVLKGTVITTSDNAVVYLDKATGTTSTISGDSIKTGSITSNNYKKNSSGTLINLQNGVIDSKNFKVDENGNAKLNGEINATKGTFGSIITDKGLLTNLQFSDENYVGFSYGYTAIFPTKRLAIVIPVYISDNFTISSATLTIAHNSVNFNPLDDNGNPKGIKSGNATRVDLIKGDSIPTQFIDYGANATAFYHIVPLDKSWGRIVDHLGNDSNGHTFNGNEKILNRNIKPYISNGFNCFALANYNYSPTNEEDASYKTGFIYATINVTGYTKI